jgi:hypothetical protein
LLVDRAAELLRIELGLLAGSADGTDLRMLDGKLDRATLVDGGTELGGAEGRVNGNKLGLSEGTEEGARLGILDGWSGENDAWTFWVVPVYWMGWSCEFEMVGGLEYWMVLCSWTVGLLNDSVNWKMLY